MADEKNYVIDAPAFNFTKYGAGLAGTIGTLAPAILAAIDKLGPGNVPIPVFVAGFAVLGAGMLAAALLASVDVLARAYVTAATKRSAMESEASPSLPTRQALVMSALATPGVPLEVKIRGRGRTPFQVLALRWDAEHAEGQYLVGRHDEKPVWTADADVECLFVTSGPAGHTNGKTASSAALAATTGLALSE